MLGKNSVDFKKKKNVCDIFNRSRKKKANQETSANLSANLSSRHYYKLTIEYSTNAVEKFNYLN